MRVKFHIQRDAKAWKFHLWQSKKKRKYLENKSRHIFPVETYIAARVEELKVKDD